MPIMEISIVPIGTKTASVSKYVADAIKMLREEIDINAFEKNDIKYKLTAMGTIIQANSIEQLLKIAGKMHNTVFKDQVKRVVTTIKIDDRKDKKNTIINKINSVENKLKEY